MKKLLTMAVMVTAIVLSSCEYDDGKIWDSVHGLEDRVVKLEELCKQMNTNISSLQTIVTALQNNDYVTGVTPVLQNGKEVGYTITFSKSSPITIFHGKDGANGSGHTPVIGVKRDTDGVYYWTLDGSWLTDERGDKIKAEGKDGKDGSDGEDGSDGTNGNDGITPKFKIENDYWFISYDGGDTWTQVGKATGEDGKDGEDGVSGDSMFSDVDYKTSPDYVIFTLPNGTQIKLPTWSAFEALQRLCNETNTNLSALQTIVTALQNNDYITSVDPLTENGKVVGYTIKFAKSNLIVIYNGKDGADGVDGNTPVIGVNKDTDGIYYWTLNGEFIVADGQKIKAQGADGNNGTDGSDGVTPKLEIRDGYWFVSYDNGTTWTQLGKATGEDGKDGTSVFKGVTQDDDNVYFELTDGTIITIAKFGQSKEDIDDSKIIQFKDAEVKAICVQNWDTNKDGELSYNEAAKVTSIKKFFRGTAIQSFEELQYFILIDEIEAEAFMQCYELKSITIPDNVTWIEQNAFKNCISLNDITIPNNTTWIGSYAFSGCKKMQNVTLNDNLKIIKDYSFYQCTSLTSIVIPEGVTRIENNAFSSCSSLTSIVIPESVTSIGVGAFSGCSSLTNINIPESVTSIGGSAFSGCSSLTNITIPEGITSIEDWTFRNCSNLINIILPESITKIEKWVFSNCSSLTSITIPKNVASIGTGIFEYTPNLKIVYCAPIDPPAVLNDTFYEMSSNVTFYVPSISVNRYKTAVNWGKYANRIVGYDFTE